MCKLYYTNSEVLTILNWKLNTLDQQCSKRKIPYIKFGKERRFPKEEFNRWNATRLRAFVSADEAIRNIK